MSLMYRALRLSGRRVPCVILQHKGTTKIVQGVSAGLPTFRRHSPSALLIPSQRHFTSGSTEDDELSVQEYHKLADAVFEVLEEEMDTLEEHFDESRDGEFDLNNAQGVLNLSLGVHGTWVLNKQAPNKQIWWSSPLSGPKRFRYSNTESTWVDTRQGVKLFDLLAEEMRQILGVNISFNGEH